MSLLNKLQEEEFLDQGYLILPQLYDQEEIEENITIVRGLHII